MSLLLLWGRNTWMVSRQLNWHCSWVSRFVNLLQSLLITTSSVCDQPSVNPLVWKLNPPWSQYRPPHPSLHSHCHGSWQVPWTQPGCRVHSSQRSPCHPWRHMHSPGDSQKPCSLHPTAQMADGRRREVKGGKREREGKGERGGENITMSACSSFESQNNSPPPPLRASHTPLQVPVKHRTKQLARTTKATHAVSFHARQRTLSCSACPC